MNKRPTPLILRIIPYLPAAEKVLLIGFTIGLVLIFTNTSGKGVAQIALGGLAIVYFLSSFRNLDVPRTEEQPFEFKDLLTWIIIPRIFWIGSAFSLLGILFYSFQLGHEGYMRALMPGGSVILIGLAVIFYAYVTGTKNLAILLPTLLRAIPIMLIAFYVIWITIKSRG